MHMTFIRYRHTGPFPYGLTSYQLTRETSGFSLLISVTWCVTGCGISGVRQLLQIQRRSISYKTSSSNQQPFVWSVQSPTAVAAASLPSIAADDNWRRRNANCLRQS